MAPRLRSARGRFALATLAALLILGLPAPPASADSRTYTKPHLHAGMLYSYGPFTGPDANFDIGAACQWTHSITFNDAGTAFSALVTYKTETTLYGDGAPTTHILRILLSMTGTFGGNPLSVTATGLMSAFFLPRNGDCNHNNVVDCHVTATDIAITGTVHDHGHGVHALAGGHGPGGDHLDLSGANSATKTTVDGDECGGMATAFSQELSGWVIDSF